MGGKGSKPHDFRASLASITVEGEDVNDKVRTAQNGKRLTGRETRQAKQWRKRGERREEEVRKQCHWKSRPAVVIGSFAQEAKAKKEDRARGQE